MDLNLKEKITIRGYYVLPRYFYHRPPGPELCFAKSGQGLKAYKNKGTDGSTPAIERAFGVENPSIIWLSPRDCYGQSYIVDLSLLDEKNIKPTGQCEGNLWHLGNIPAAAVVKAITINEGD